MISNVGKMKVELSSLPLVAYYPVLVSTTLFYEPNSCNERGYNFMRTDYIQLYYSLRNINCNDLYKEIDVDKSLSEFYNQLYLTILKIC